MNSISDNHYIYYSKSGLIYNYYKENTKLYLELIKNNKIYIKKKLASNVFNFSICIDTNDIFHMAILFDSGELMYSKYYDEDCIFSTITNCNLKSENIENIKIFHINNTPHLLFASSNMLNSELWILKHFHLTNKRWYGKKICEIVNEKYNTPFNVDIDFKNNIHIVFKSLYNKKYYIFHTKYNSIYNHWTNPVKIPLGHNIHSTPFILCDKYNLAHIVWSVFENNNQVIKYSYNDKLNSINGLWSNSEIISDCNSNSSMPFIIQTDEIIKIIWEDNDSFLCKEKNSTTNLWINNYIDLGFYVPNLRKSIIMNQRFNNYSYVKIPYTFSLFDNNLYLLGLNFNSYNQKKINLPFNEKLLSNPTTISNFYEIEDFIFLMENLEKKQESINNLLNIVNENQKLTTEKIDSLFDKYNSLKEPIKRENTSMLNKLFTFFK